MLRHVDKGDILLMVYRMRVGFTHSGILTILFLGMIEKSPDDNNSRIKKSTNFLWKIYRICVDYWSKFEGENNGENRIEIQDIVL